MRPLMRGAQRLSAEGTARVKAQRRDCQCAVGKPGSGERHLSREPGHPAWPPELIEGSGALAQSSRMALGTFGEQEGVALVKCAF